MVMVWKGFLYILSHPCEYPPLKGARRMDPVWTYVQTFVVFCLFDRFPKIWYAGFSKAKKPNPKPTKLNSIP